LTRLLLATRSAGKLRELRPLLAGLAGEGLALETLAAHPEVRSPEEAGESFEENARLKAGAAAGAAGLWTLGEDSGLEVDALGGAPGVRSARYSGAHGDDAANNARLLRELGSSASRRARYVCVAALARPDGVVVATARGVCEGTIAASPRGSGGFGYDPLFVPDGETRTMAELSPREKEALSHRGRAIRALLPELRSHLRAASFSARRAP
jgi:XTP/dITP diphosphohydrolase